MLPDEDFARVSKTVILNLSRLRSISWESTRKLVCTMADNGQVYAHSRYLPELKKKLGVYEGGWTPCL